MHVVDIIWLPHVLDKLTWKHHVSPEEVAEVLCDTPLYRLTHEALILSARDVDEKERRQYARR